MQAVQKGLQMRAARKDKDESGRMKAEVNRASFFQIS
jgi:hypothetical protein